MFPIESNDYNGRIISKNDGRWIGATFGENENVMYAMVSDTLNSIHIFLKI